MRSRLLGLGFPEQSIRHQVQEVVRDSRRDAVFLWWVRGGIAPVLRLEIESTKDDAGADVPGDPKIGRATIGLTPKTIGIPPL